MPGFPREVSEGRVSPRSCLKTGFPQEVSQGMVSPTCFEAGFPRVLHCRVLTGFSHLM